MKVKITKTDIILIIIISLFIVYFVYQSKNNLGYKWDWKSIPQFFYQYENGKFSFNILSKGLFTTIKLSIWTIIFATIFGVVIGIMKTSKRLFFKLSSSFFVSIFRNTPPIVLIFIFYFFIADQMMSYIGIEEYIENLSPFFKNIIIFTTTSPEYISSFIAGVLTLSLYEGAYISEIIRSGIESVDKGQLEAADALGLKKYHRMIYIIFPQSLKLILPPLGGQFISTIKDSAIISVIAIPELTFQGMELMASTFMTFEIWISITLIYFILCFSCSKFFSLLEKNYSSY
jgi:polar amino acid transport system permease protein